MPIRHYNIDPPFLRQTGDTFVLNGTVYEQWRGGMLIDSRDLTQQTNELITDAVHFGDSEVTQLYLEEHMPGVMATLTAVDVNETTGEYLYSFSDGNSIGPATRITLLTQFGHLDTNPDTPKGMLILQSLRKDKGGSDPQVMVGQSCTCDCSGLSPVSMSAQVGPS